MDHEVVSGGALNGNWLVRGKVDWVFGAIVLLPDAGIVRVDRNHVQLVVCRLVVTVDISPSLLLMILRVVRLLVRRVALQDEGFEGALICMLMTEAVVGFAVRLISETANVGNTTAQNVTSSHDG